MWTGIRSGASSRQRTLAGRRRGNARLPSTAQGPTQAASLAGAALTRPGTTPPVPALGAKQLLQPPLPGCTWHLYG
eukprot:8545653-Pyramimonas_sp.AAC.1